jgi:enoyl-CoA hydratase
MTTSASSSPVAVEAPRPGVLVVRLDRPDRLNAIDDALIAGLHDAIDTVERDQRCRTVILTGAGRGFCAGFDMKGGDYDGDPASRPLADLLAGQKRLSAVALRLHELPKAVIAAVNGPAAGGGFALAVAADVRVASTSAVFLAANVRIGVSGGEMGLSWRLPRLIGLARATELLLTARRLTAEEALTMGLVSRVVPDDELLDAAFAVADQVATTSSFGTWMTKELLDVSEGAGSFRQALQLEDRTQVLCNFTGDVAEAVAAFREGRLPRFS